MTTTAVTRGRNRSTTDCSMKQQRNQPCACGSGKKFKRCCGNEAVLCAQREEAWKLAREQRAERAKKAREEMDRALEHGAASSVPFGRGRRTNLMAGILMAGALAAIPMGGRSRL